MTTRVKWAAQLDHVQEVSILGSADLGLWQQRLAREELIPLDRDGRATILIVTAAGRFMGVRFRETKVYPFLAGEDTLWIQPQEPGDPFHILSESAFVPETWIIRSNTCHAKSKTYMRRENVEFPHHPVGE